MEYNLPTDFSDFGMHLKGRGLKPWHKVTVDPVTQVVTFPLWSFEKEKMIGYQRYNWRETKLRDNGGKYFTWVSDNYKNRVAYGHENCYGHGPLFIVEGVWDSLSVVNCYFDCLALLTCTPSKNLKAHLRQLAGNRPIVALCDNDLNTRASDKMIPASDFHFYPPTGKDVNDLPYDVCFDWLTSIRKMV